MQETDAAAIASEPVKRIRRLDEDTVNKIAAAEIIQRPANAVKELLENALDARSTRIAVVAKEGGLKSLSIQDNGCGIHEEDLPLLCERFCTSKLTRFEDLRSLTSYGFRGEALASISHVARLTCITKRKQAPYGLKAVYSAGLLAPARPGAPDAAPKPSAANDGTQILVEDLFLNVPMRRKSLRSGADEYARLLGVVSKYAIHNAGVAMSCKKYASSSPDLNTMANATVPENVAHVYGESIRRDLVHIEVARHDELGFSGQGWCSGPNYSGKKSVFLIFINNRLVDSQALRKAFEAFYTTVLPKGGHPFVYFSLAIDPHKIDVNVHPTKHEVVFEDEDEIVQHIVEQLSTTLSRQATSRRFASSQAQSRQAPPSPMLVEFSSGGSTPMQSRPPSSQKGAPQKVIRTDSTARTLESMLGYAATQQNVPQATASDQEQQSRARPDPHEDQDLEMVPPSAPARTPAASRPGLHTMTSGSLPMTKCNLASIQQLRRGVENTVHHELKKVIGSHTFVGLVGPDRPESLIQHETKLYLIDHVRLSEELFYQLGLRQFGRLGKLQLDPAPRVEQLISLAVACEAPEEEVVGLSEQQITQKLTDVLIERREMLLEYFALDISEDGVLRGLPLLLPQYKPNLDRLPLFLLRAALEVDWSSEKECFDTFLHEVAFFYAPSPLNSTHSSDASAIEREDGSAESPEDLFSSTTREQDWQIRHVLFPAMQKYLMPPVKLVNDNAVKQVASMESLFRVFERC